MRVGGPKRRFRLYCFPYAGGSAASFMPWQSALEPNIEVCAVQLPGRAARMTEAPVKSLPQLVETIANTIASQDSLPFAFFGHSLGGLVAFEVTRYCMHKGLPMPLHLFASGCNAPQHRGPRKQLHLMPDLELITALKEYNGTPSELLEHQELMELVLPTLRADFSLAENYSYHSTLRLPTPITVLAGKRDDHVQLEQVEGWRKETMAGCRIEWFEGDHFFINQESHLVLECIRNELQSLKCM